MISSFSLLSLSEHSSNSLRSPHSYEERRRLKYGTITQRLGADSIRDFDVCCTCLKQAIDAVACCQGHLYCRECILESLLTQKQHLKKNLREFEAEQRETAAKASGLGNSERKKAVDVAAFEKAESSLLPFEETEDDDQALPEKKRQKTSYDPSLRSFWVPSLAPAEAKTKTAKPDKHPRCPEGGETLRLKHLRSVKFELLKGTSSNSSRRSYQCPSCRKTLTNSSKTVWLSACGHVVCKTCHETLVKTECACVHCGKKVTKKHPAIPFQVGGTGFSGHGAPTTAKIVTPAFQG